MSNAIPDFYQGQYVTIVEGSGMTILGRVDEVLTGQAAIDFGFTGREPIYSVKHFGHHHEGGIYLASDLRPRRPAKRTTCQTT